MYHLPTCISTYHEHISMFINTCLYQYLNSHMMYQYIQWPQCLYNLVRRYQQTVVLNLSGTQTLFFVIFSRIVLMLHMEQIQNNFKMSGFHAQAFLQMFHRINTLPCLLSISATTSLPPSNPWNECTPLWQEFFVSFYSLFLLQVDKTVSGHKVLSKYLFNE